MSKSLIKKIIWSLIGTVAGFLILFELLPQLVENNPSGAFFVGLLLGVFAGYVIGKGARK